MVQECLSASLWLQYHNIHRHSLFTHSLSTVMDERGYSDH